MLPERFDALVAIVILAGAIWSYIREKLPPDLTSLLAILALLVSGILSPIEAFAGFSHPASISVAAVWSSPRGWRRPARCPFWPAGWSARWAARSSC